MILETSPRPIAPRYQYRERRDRMILESSPRPIAPHRERRDPDDPRDLTKTLCTASAATG